MKYSIIIPYRNRESHLQILLPTLVKRFKNFDYEIIVSEQNDNNNFQIACVENIGYQYATGDILVFHQVDYIPSEDVNYEPPILGALLPAKRGIFLNDDMTLRPTDDIPVGYRKFVQEIDPAFYGGVLVVPRHDFEYINGFNPLYKGWGNEDEDVRERFKHYNIAVTRNDVGTFWILNHKDNCPQIDDPRYKDFMTGRQMYHEFTKYLDAGIKGFTADVEVFDTSDDTMKVTWLKSTNYRINNENI